MIEVLKQAVVYFEHMVRTLQLRDESEPAQLLFKLRQAIAELESQEPFEDLATELFVVAQVSPADNGFSETIERIESWLREHFTHPPQRTEQEPVANDFFRMIADRNPKPFPLPQRTWVGLTDVEIDYLLGSTVGENEETHISFARAIEAKLKQKNG